jgi:hypothetical protein
MAQPPSVRALAVEQAMVLLLTKRQIAYVKTRTFTGSDKVGVIRALLNRVIDAEEQRCATELRTMDATRKAKPNPVVE